MRTIEEKIEVALSGGVTGLSLPVKRSFRFSARQAAGWLDAGEAAEKPLKRLTEYKKARGLPSNRISVCQAVAEVWTADLSGHASRRV